MERFKVGRKILKGCCYMRQFGEDFENKSFSPSCEIIYILIYCFCMYQVPLFRFFYKIPSTNTTLYRKIHAIHIQYQLTFLLHLCHIASNFRSLLITWFGKKYHAEKPGLQAYFFASWSLRKNQTTFIALYYG